MAWVILFIAVFTEICWALSLKWAGDKGTWLAAIVPISLSFVNMGLLALAMRGIPAGTAYAVWTGLGAVGASSPARSCSATGYRRCRACSWR